MKKGRSIYDFVFACDEAYINQLVQSYLNANGFKLIEKKGESFYRGGDAMSGHTGFKYYINNKNIRIEAWVIAIIGDLQLEFTINLLTNKLINDYKKTLNTLFEEIQKTNHNITQTTTQNTISNDTQMNQFINQNNMQQSNNQNIIGYDSQVNQPVNQNNMQQSNNQNIISYDPQTGQPINQNNVQQTTNQNIIGYDSQTGQPIYQNDIQQSNNQNNINYNQQTSQPMYQNYVQKNDFQNKFSSDVDSKNEKTCEIGFWLSIVGLILPFTGITFGLVVYIFTFYTAAIGLKTKKRGKAIATIVLSVIGVLIWLFSLLALISQL